MFKPQKGEKSEAQKRLKLEQPQKSEKRHFYVFLSGTISDKKLPRGIIPKGLFNYFPHFFFFFSKIKKRTEPP